MKVIYPMSNDLLEKWKDQYYIEGYDYKPIIYLHSIAVDEGILLYNLMTYELILITKKEYDHFNNGTLLQYNKLLYRFFVTHWFMIPSYCDERSMVYVLNSGARDHRYFDRYIDRFTVFTTTGCNARCYYCYEKGARRVDMTDTVAHDVASYILKKSDPTKPVRVAWFGGEPLFNMRAMDIISKDIIDGGRDYYSTMISNAYLFDEEVVKKAKELWHLTNVQITFDGTEDIYNRTKSYIYKTDESPYKRIFRNIQLLIDEKINVCVRLNIGKTNAPDMYRVVDELYDAFGGSKYVQIYAATLFEGVENNPLVRTEDERKEVFEEMFKLEDYILEKNMFTKPSLCGNGYSMMHCMADNPQSCMISAEGNIGSCEHHIDDDFYGTIYDHRLDKDYELVKAWKYVNEEVPECQTCFYHPRCRRLDRCVVEGHCDANVRIDHKRKVDRIMINTFNEFKKKNIDIIERYVERHQNDE